jgi:hypothetical protein
LSVAADQSTSTRFGPAASALSPPGTLGAVASAPPKLTTTGVAPLPCFALTKRAPAAPSNHQAELAAASKASRLVDRATVEPPTVTALGGVPAVSASIATSELAALTRVIDSVRAVPFQLEAVMPLVAMRVYWRPFGVSTPATWKLMPAGSPATSANTMPWVEAVSVPAALRTSART